MIECVRGNLFASRAEALVNTVNCVGVMGKGLALQFRNRYPENYRAYQVACHRRELKPGRMYVFETGRLFAPQLIVNFPTKRHWRDASRLEDIRAGLDDLVLVLDKRRVRSVAVPPLGCGLGGLDWNEVRPLVLEAAGRLPKTKFLLYEP